MNKADLRAHLTRQALESAQDKENETTSLEMAVLPGQPQRKQSGKVDWLDAVESDIGAP